MLKKIAATIAILSLASPAIAGGVERKYRPAPPAPAPMPAPKPMPMPKPVPQVPPPSYQPPPPAYRPAPPPPKPYVYQPPVYVPPPAPVYAPPVPTAVPCGMNGMPCGPKKPHSRFGLYAGIGTAFIGNGNLTSEHKGVVNANEVSFSDVYDVGLTAEIGLTYEVSPRGEIVGGIGFTKFNGGEITIGNIVSEALSNRNEPLIADFSDYSVFSIEGGYRHYLSDLAFKPYVSARAGVVLVDEVTADFRADFPEAGIAWDVQDATIYDETSTFKVEGNVGFLYAPNHYMGVGMETGLAYIGALDGSDSDLSALPLEGINEKGGLAYVPLKLVGRINF